MHGYCLGEWDRIRKKKKTSRGLFHKRAYVGVNKPKREKGLLRKKRAGEVREDGGLPVTRRRRGGEEALRVGRIP